MDIIGAGHAALKAGLPGLHVLLETCIEDPEQSPPVRKNPGVFSDHHARGFITDNMRLVVGGSMNPFEPDSLMDLQVSNRISIIVMSR